MKMMIKLKQTTFVESLQELSKEFAGKTLAQEKTILQQQETIIQLERRILELTEKPISDSEDEEEALLQNIASQPDIDFKTKSNITKQSGNKGTDKDQYKKTKEAVSYTHLTLPTKRIV